MVALQFPRPANRAALLPRQQVLSSVVFFCYVVIAICLCSGLLFRGCGRCGGALRLDDLVGDQVFRVGLQTQSTVARGYSRSPITDSSVSVGVQHQQQISKLAAVNAAQL